MSTKDCVKPHPDDRQSRKAGSRFRNQVCSYWIWNGYIDTWAEFIYEYNNFPVSASFYKRPTPIRLSPTSHKLSNWRCLWKKSTSKNPLQNHDLWSCKFKGPRSHQSVAKHRLCCKSIKDFSRFNTFHEYPVFMDRLISELMRTENIRSYDRQHIIFITEQ